MNNAKHTPAPWDVSGNEIWGISPWNARFKIATVTMPSPMNAVDWSANARLIAAAPETAAERDRLKEINAELTQVLEELLPYAEQEAQSLSECNKRDGDCEDEMNECNAWIDKARAAIAKARGESEAA
ncbi:MAG TPA: hypothetical protein VFE62_01410 [Gemmataceae bacterium]|nr:hypothetical protein [Gemmataceae bacterium]